MKKVTQENNGSLAGVEPMLEYFWNQYAIKESYAYVHPRNEAKAQWFIGNKRIYAVCIWLSDTHARTLKQWWFDRPWNLQLDCITQNLISDCYLNC